jgi:uncharacterized membrane protein YeiH
MISGPAAAPLTAEPVNLSLVMNRPYSSGYVRPVTTSLAVLQAATEVLADESDGAINEVINTKPKLPPWTLYLAVLFGALSGATFAARRGFDVVGVLGLATAQGIGGLLIAQILVAAGTPEVLTDPLFMLIVVVAAVLGFFLSTLVTETVGSSLVLDALSLGLLAGAGTNLAMRNSLDSAPAVFIGVVAAIGGFILRDILSGRAPDVLRPGIFSASAALIGSVAFVLLRDIGATLAFAQTMTVAIVAIIRVLSVWLGWETKSATDYSDRVKLGLDQDSSRPWNFWQGSK